MEFENQQLFTTNEQYQFAKIGHQLNRDGVKELFLKWHVLHGIERHMFDAVIRLPHVRFPVDDTQQQGLGVSHDDVLPIGHSIDADIANHRTHV